MTQEEYKISEEQKSLAYLRGIVTGATGCAIFIGIIKLLIYLGL